MRPLLSRFSFSSAQWRCLSSSHDVRLERRQQTSVVKVLVFLEVVFLLTIQKTLPISLHLPTLGTLLGHLVVAELGGDNFLRWLV